MCIVLVGGLRTAHLMDLLLLRPFTLPLAIDCNRSKYVTEHILGYGLTETSPLTHCNPSENYRYDTVGLAAPNTEFKVRCTRARRFD